MEIEHNNQFGVSMERVEKATKMCNKNGLNWTQHACGISSIHKHIDELMTSYALKLTANACTILFRSLSNCLPLLSALFLQCRFLTIALTLSIKQASRKYLLLTEAYSIQRQPDTYGNTNTTNHSRMLTQRNITKVEKKCVNHTENSPIQYWHNIGDVIRICFFCLCRFARVVEKQSSVWQRKHRTRTKRKVWTDSQNNK